MKALVIAVMLLLSTVALARGGRGGGHSYSSHSSSRSHASHSSYRSHASGSRRSEHVSSYTRNGRAVRSYRRAPAGMGEHHHSSTPHVRSVSATAGRNPHGHITRSESAKHQFETQTGYPHGRPGYVVDHRIALACGGADAPSNMQWQTVAEGKAKDKWERKGCGGRR